MIGAVAGNLIGHGSRIGPVAGVIIGTTVGAMIGAHYDELTEDERWAQAQAIARALDGRPGRLHRWASPDGSMRAHGKVEILHYPTLSRDQAAARATLPDDIFCLPADDLETDGDGPDETALSDCSLTSSSYTVTVPVQDHSGRGLYRRVPVAAPRRDRQRRP